MKRLLDPDALHALARGCAILGEGGGGDSYVALLQVLQATEDFGPAVTVSLITVSVALFNRIFSPIPLPEVDLDRYLRYWDVSLLRFSELLVCIAAAVLLRRLIPIFNTSRPSSSIRRLSVLR